MAQLYKCEKILFFYSKLTFSIQVVLSLGLTIIQFSECTRYTGPAACLCEVWWTTPPVTLSTRYTVTNAVHKWVVLFYHEHLNV